MGLSHVALHSRQRAQILSGGDVGSPLPEHRTAYRQRHRGRQRLQSPPDPPAHVDGSGIDSGCSGAWCGERCDGLWRVRCHIDEHTPDASAMSSSTGTMAAISSAQSSQSATCASMRLLSSGVSLSSSQAARVSSDGQDEACRSWSVRAHESPRLATHQGCPRVAITVFDGHRSRSSHRVALWHRIYEHVCQNIPGDARRASSRRSPPSSCS